MRYFRLVVQYDGTDFAGFQIQPDVPTVQGELQRALKRVLGHEVRITAAGRTDAGVHAIGQVVAFGTELPIPAEGVVRALNGTLPQTVSIVAGQQVGAEFHPRYDAVAKLYSYRILNRALPSPFIGRYAWHVEKPLQVDAMTQAAERLLGRHEFSAFEAAGSSVENKVRVLSRLDCRRQGDTVEVHAQADGFLYMMVRNIVGTLVEVGLGRLRAEAVAGILASRDRVQAGPTAPPRGLCLVRVDY